jgi:tetratricopeptide (TPR) repeat protein
LLLSGDLADFRGDAEKKALLIKQALDIAGKTGDRKVIGMCLMEMGLVKRDHDYSEAVQGLSQSLSCFRELGESLWECRTSFLLAETHVMYGNLEAARPLLERGLELCRAVNDSWQIAWGLEGLGNVQRLEGNFEQARQLYAESLTLKASVMDKLGIAFSLAAFAQLAATQKQFKRAMILWAAADHLGQTINLLIIPSRSGQDKAGFVETRAQLEEKDFDKAWNQGWAMKLGEAIEYALSGV